MTDAKSTPLLGDGVLLLAAYVDGELDAAAALDFERRMETDPPLRRDYDQLLALRSAVHGKVRRDLASDRLRQRIGLPSEQAERRALQPRSLSHQSKAWTIASWQQIAASMLLGAVLASGALTLARRGDMQNVEIASLVAEHRRALLATNSLDVESTDAHTVKPWFNSKLALAPQVHDLAKDGFPLAGGRVEVVGGALVPAMLYRRRNHVVSLVAVPHSGERMLQTSPSNTTLDGYTVTQWSGQDFNYFAISDIAPNELAAFVTAWRATP